MSHIKSLFGPREVVTHAVIPGLERKRQVDFYEFEASLAHRVGSRIAQVIYRGKKMFVLRQGLL